MMDGHYILDDLGNAVPCPDFLEWARFFSRTDARRLARTAVSDTIDVSTVFLGRDHGLWDGGPPVLWETLVFGGEHDQWCHRYTSKDAARTGHNRVVAWLRGEGPEP